MKKSLMGIGAMMLVAGLIAGTSLIHAGQPKPSVDAGGQTQDEGNTPGEEWHASLSAVLETHEAYTAAEDRLEAFNREVEQKRARLKTALDEIYYKLARSVYQDHFGPWEGDDDEFIALLAAADQVAAIRGCTAKAIKECGKGNVKTVEVTAGGACVYGCFTPVPSS